MTLSGDIDLLASDSEANIVPIGAKRTNSAAALADSLGRLLAGGGDPDSAHDLAIRAEAAAEWAGDSLEKLELAIALLTHLRQRHPAGITDATLAFHLGEAKYALALVRGERILEADAPPEADIDRVLDDFAEAAAGFREGAAGGFSARGNMDQGVVNLESGAFLKELAARWDRGAWSALAARWRDEARRRIEASIPPFNHAIATSGPSSLASRRARWSRGRALELLGEWRSAAADFLSLMNNSELPRLVRANAARRWAMCMGELGESRQALTRLTAFADFDAEAALLAGRLAETAGLLQSAYRHYLSAADPDAVGLPPLTPERSREAAFRAARIALADPAGADPLHPPEQVVHEARSLLETNAFADLDGDWAVPALNLLGENLMTDSGGWRETFAVAERAIGQAKKDTAVDRAMHILAARALTAGGEYADALDQLDAARELLDDGPRSRVDAARVTLETARIYRLQGRFEDAVRAYTDVFAVYPDIVEAETAARAEAATMLLSMPDAGPAERERAVGILRGLRDQIEATRILRQFGMY